MKFNQQVLLKHKYGITAQWISDDFSWTAVATYQQTKVKNGPWSTVMVLGLG